LEMRLGLGWRRRWLIHLPRLPSDAGMMTATQGAVNAL
jgi:hypothetical protein